MVLAGVLLSTAIMLGLAMQVLSDKVKARVLIWLCILQLCSDIAGIVMLLKVIL